MYNKKAALITNRGLGNNINCKSPEIQIDITNSLIEIQQTIHQVQVVRANLPINPPFEKHPYLEEYQLQDFEKYIIGTCPPVSYLCDSLDVDELIAPDGNVISKPDVSFFHGNKLNQWKMFLTDLEWNVFNILGRNDRKEYLIEMLNNNEINYSDIIQSFQRANYTVEDNDIRNICININLIKDILKNPKAKYLNFNTSSVFNKEGLSVKVNNPDRGKVNVKNIGSYDLFLRSLQDLGFNLEVNLLNGYGWLDINAENSDYLKNNYKYKVLTELKISSNQNIKIDDVELSNFNSTFTIITSPSPSGSASRGLGGNQVYTNWHNNPENINLQTPTNEFRKQIYSHFRNNDWGQLQAMNINL